MDRRRSRRRRSVAFACAVVFAAGAAVASVRAEDDIHVVIANTGAAAVLIVNASPVVAGIVRDAVPDDVANDHLERAALRAIAPEIKLLPHAKTITVRILYDKTGDVSPVYGGPTFAGVERYATLTCDAPDARSSASKWKALGDTDALAPWLRLTIVGTLPPR